MVFSNEYHSYFKLLQNTYDNNHTVYSLTTYHQICLQEQLDGCHWDSRKYLLLQSNSIQPRFSSGPCCSIFSFLRSALWIIECLYALFLLHITLSVLPITNMVSSSFSYPVNGSSLLCAYFHSQMGDSQKDY